MSSVGKAGKKWGHTYHVFTILAVNLYQDSQNSRSFWREQNPRERKKCWGSGKVWESIWWFFLGPTMLASNVHSWYSTPTCIPTPWQSPRKCKKPRGLTKERKNCYCSLAMWEIVLLGSAVLFWDLLLVFCFACCTDIASKGDCGQEQ